MKRKYKKDLTERFEVRTTEGQKNHWEKIAVKNDKSLSEVVRDTMDEKYPVKENK